MKLCSVTLHNRTDELALDALRSVLPFVDACVILDTHAEPYGFEREREVASEKLIVHRHRAFTCEDPSDKVRALSLTVATDLGFDWACILDTDERIRQAALVPGGGIRGLLEVTTADVIGAESIARDYAKARFFRLPMRGEWLLPAHEFFRCSGEYAIEPGIVFEELPKTPEQEKQKLEDVCRVLTRYVTETPEAPEQARAWEFLGHSLRELGYPDRALPAYRRAIESGPTEESSGYLHYCIALCGLALEDYPLAIRAGCSGLIQTPWMAELPFIAAIAEMELGNFGKATARASAAVSLGYARGIGASIKRAGFRNLAALWEGPFVILEEACRALGNDAEADRAGAIVTEAIKAREAHGGHHDR